jgi:hypothetical protein
MSDAKQKTKEEIIALMRRAQDRAASDHIGLYEAMEREGIPKTTYYAYKQRLEMLDKMKTMGPQEIKEYYSSLTSDTPHTEETTTLNKKEKHRQGRHRISIDLPNDVYDAIDKEHMESTFSTKSICQRIIIKYVKEKQMRGDRLF